MKDNYSISELERCAEFNSALSGFLARSTCRNYEDFVNQLYCDIDICISALEQSRHLYQSKGEDLLSDVILKQLKGMGYDAEHDTQHGGHCDLLVKGTQPTFEWIGEAKLWNGASYVYGGFEQLTRRYATGTANDSHGGMLIYIYKPDALSFFEKWIEHLKETSLPLEANDNVNKLRHDTIHKHVGSGLPYSVRHMAVVLNHETTTA